MPIHAARMNHSDRLARVFALLRMRGVHGVTSRDLANIAQTVAPGTCVSELRANGCKIKCVRRGDVWTYYLAAKRAA